MSSTNPTYGSYNAAAATDAPAIDANARTVHYKCGDCDQDIVCCISRGRTGMLDF
jgi:hypothetical protein